MKPAKLPPESPVDIARIPLVEEAVHVRPQAVETRKVRVHKHVETQHQTIDKAMLRDDVEVARIPVGREVERTEPPREVDGVMIVPVYEEELVVRKRLVLKEEVHIRRHRHEYREPIEVTLRKEHATVEQEQARPSKDSEDEVR